MFKFAFLVYFSGVLLCKTIFFDSARLWPPLSYAATERLEREDRKEKTNYAFMPNFFQCSILDFTEYLKIIFIIF